MDAAQPTLSLGTIRKLLRDGPEVWAQRDTRNRWFCPHCGDVVNEIVVPLDRGSLLQDFPHHLLTHLKQCGAVKNNLPPSKRLATNNAATSGMNKSLHEARLHQRHMLKPPPKLEGFEFSCLYRSMEALGGDFYDFVEMPGGNCGISIGDASGHGVEACMLMAVTKKLFTVFGRTGLSAKDCLTAVNKEIFDDVMQGIFITAGYSVLDPHERILTYARAGHPPVMLFNPKRDPRVMHLHSNGLALGVDRGTRFDRVIEERSIELQSGDLLVFYTDGIVELEVNGKEIGPEGLAEMLAKVYDRPVDDIVGWLWNQAEKIFKDKQPDDITLVLARAT